MLILSSCGGKGGYAPNEDAERKNFYQGTEGVRMLIQPGAPPSRVYYYSDLSEQENKFDIEIDLHNVGTSYTRGGVYVSGYDPSLIYVEGINIEKTGDSWWQDCRFGLNFLASAIGGGINCNFGESGGAVGWDGRGAWNTNINNLFQMIGLSGLPELDFSYNSQTGQGSFNVDLWDLMMDGVFDRYPGVSLLSLIGGLKFDRFNGEEFNLIPDDHNYPGGESTIVPFPARIQNTWPQGLDEANVNLLFTTCYAYATFATPTVCIDPDPFSQNRKACLTSQVEMTSSQGAPVAVTSVRQESTPKSAIFTIYVQNVGGGTIIHPGDLELCSPYYPGRLSAKSLDVVLLGSVRMSGSDQRLKCSPDDRTIRLREGRGQITCIYNYEYGTTKSAYKAPLIIELWYGYSQTQMRTVKIKRVS